MSSKTPILETQKLSRVLGAKVKQTILHALDLTFSPGDFVALTGASGSGKSTLLYLLGALDRPSAGRVIIDGVDASELDDDDRAHLRNEKLGFVFQFHFLLPEFNVRENVMVPMLRRGLSKDEAGDFAERALEFLEIGELWKRRPNELSGGQQQRVAIARAVANQPAILLADEPTGNLDSKNAELVVALFERLNVEQRMTIVMVTHDAHFAERAGRRLTLRDGRVVADEGSGVRASGTTAAGA